MTLLLPVGEAQPVRHSGAISFPSDAEVRKLLSERVDALAGTADGIGMVVGLIGPQGQRVVSYGHANQGDSRPLTGNTVFEIGSVSKVFTALLLADMARRGEVSLTDPVKKYLFAGVQIPERSGRAITLLDLATHTSGLPFMPDVFPIYGDPAAGRYTAAEMYRFLASYQLARDPGAEWDYSNVGYWLLGQALAARSGLDYEGLLRSRILTPLKLGSTAITLTPALKTKLAPGHNAMLQPAPSFSAVSIYGDMPAAGGLVSTVSDLLRFLSVVMGYKSSPLAASMAAMLSARRPMDGSEQALGWVVAGKGDDQLIMHDGATWGYTSCVTWDPTQRVGVVVLSNQLTSVTDIAHHLLRPNVPLEKPEVTKHVEIMLDSAALDAYVGRYEVPQEGVIHIDRVRDFLTVELPVHWGIPKFRLRPESPQSFFVAELPIRVTFQASASGRVNSLLVYPPHAQRALTAKRMDSEK